MTRKNTDLINIAAEAWNQKRADCKRKLSVWLMWFPRKCAGKFTCSRIPEDSIWTRDGRSTRILPKILSYNNSCRLFCGVYVDAEKKNRKCRIRNMTAIFKFGVHMDRSCVKTRTARKESAAIFWAYGLRICLLLRLVQDRVKSSRTGNSFSGPLGSGILLTDL
jgi:hypothetical protein